MGAGHRSLSVRFKLKKTMKKTKILKYTIGGCIIGIMLISITLLLDYFKETALPEEKPQADVEVNLLLSKAPKVGEIAELALKVTPHKYASNALVKIDVPRGIELIEGNTEWKGKIEPNQTVFLNIKIKPLETGDYYLKGYIINKIPIEQLGPSELTGDKTKVIPLSTTYTLATTTAKTNLPTPNTPNLSFLIGAKPFTQINWNWEIAEFFNVYRAINPNGPWEKIITNFPQGAHTAVDYNYPKDTKTLYYRITSTDKLNESQPSEMSSVRININ